MTNIGRLEALLDERGPMTFGEAGSALGLTRRAVYRAAEAGGLSPRMLRSNCLPDVYRLEDIARAVQDVAKRSGSTSSVAYRANRKLGEPSLSTLLGRFGSWDAVLDVAGLPARNDPRGARYTKYSFDGLIEAVADSGASTLEEYRAWREDNPEAPSSDTVLGRLGGWNNARRLAAGKEQP